MNIEPVIILSSPSKTRAEPDMVMLSKNVIVSAVFPFISRYSIRKSKLSGRSVLGLIGTLNLNSSGEKPVLDAGTNDMSLNTHSPECILICNVVSVFFILSNLKLGVKV